MTLGNRWMGPAGSPSARLHAFSIAQDGTVTASGVVNANGLAATVTLLVGAESNMAGATETAITPEDDGSFSQDLATNPATGVQFGRIVVTTVAGEWRSDVVVLTVVDTVPAAPATPVGTGGSAQVSIAYVAPANTGGSPITGYKVYTYTANDNVQVGTADSDAASPYVKTGLTNGTAYYFKVAAVNAVGEGAKSVKSANVTPA